jgi:GNAT superfamily N-acetyltransferase
VLARPEALLGQEAGALLNELERIEAQAVQSAALAGGGRGAVVGGAICAAQPLVPGIVLNRAIPSGPKVDLAAIATWFRASHAVSVTPGRAELARELSERGYAQVSSWMKFTRAAEPAPTLDTELRIEETRDARLFGSLVAEGFGMAEGATDALAAIVGAPDWRAFIAFAGDEPAASAALYIHGSLAWLGIGSTRPAFRGRGAQPALLAARIEVARAAGVTTLATETGERIEGSTSPSYRNILGAGFREAYLRANWCSPR